MKYHCSLSAIQAIELFQIITVITFGCYLGIDYTDVADRYQKWLGVGLLSIFSLLSFRTLYNLSQMKSSIRAILLTSHSVREVSNLYDGG